jgi:nicotinate-nucleotide pyrophosphorylase (carboxylating)
VKLLPFTPLDRLLYREIVGRALAEDVGSGDVTTDATIDASLRARGEIVAKCNCVIAGIDLAAETFRRVDRDVEFVIRKPDSTRCSHGDIVAEIHGSARAMLTAERTALNLLQRLSGIATITRKFVDAAEGRITILDTRKTTPTLRALEKYAVRAGGGTNHRHGLHDAVLIKDNHIRLAGGVNVAIERMRAARPDMRIEIEAQRLDEVDDAVAAGVETVLLDNMDTEMIREAVKRIAGRAKVEISGGITLERIPDLASTGADYVSVGALTHSAPAADLSLEIEPDA